MLIKRLIPLYQTPNKETTRAPKIAISKLILCPLRLRQDAGHRKRSTQRKSNAANEIPEADVPAYCVPFGYEPVCLSFDHEED